MPRFAPKVGRSSAFFLATTACTVLAEDWSRGRDTRRGTPLDLLVSMWLQLCFFTCQQYLVHGSIDARQMARISSMSMHLRAAMKLFAVLPMLAAGSRSICLTKSRQVVWWSVGWRTSRCPCPKERCPHLRLERFKDQLNALEKPLNVQE